MPCVVTITAKRLQPGGTLLALPDGYKFYLMPSRGDITITLDGTTWFPWQGDPNAVGWQNAIIGVVASGSVSFSVPYTDTEVHYAGGASAPALEWNIIDPGQAVNGGTAPVRVWRGILPSAVSSPQTLDALTQLGHDPWTVASTTYNALPSGTRRQGSVTFSAGQTSAAATWPSFGSASWRITLGVRTDDTGFYVPRVVGGSETDVGCNIEISQAPPTAKTVQVDFEVR